MGASRIISTYSVTSTSPDSPGPAAPVGGFALPLLFALTLSISAALLFCVQPIIARMILPLLGGSPSVWNTCMVFFQSMLLGGYAYAHLATVSLGVRRQAVLQLGLLAMPLLVLPFVIPADEARSLSPDANPTGWLLAPLLTSVGLPFFVVATTAPLLQMWFAETGHPSGNDPYFLYGASNFGSMLALLGYPILMEPNLRLARQSMVWAVGYGALATLIAGLCGGSPAGTHRLAQTVDRPTIEAAAAAPAQPAADLGCTCIRPVESSFGGHNLPVHRRRRHPPPVGHPAGTLSTVVRPGLFKKRDSAALLDGSRHADGHCPAGDCDLSRGCASDFHPAALVDVLPGRDGLPR